MIMLHAENIILNIKSLQMKLNNKLSFPTNVPTCFQSYSIVWKSNSEYFVSGIIFQKAYPFGLLYEPFPEIVSILPYTTYTQFIYMYNLNPYRIM